MLELNKFIQILNEAEDLQDEGLLLHEKIVSKKQQARKRKLQKKRRAERKLEKKQASQQQDTAQDTVKNTQLVIYKKPSDEPSQEYKNFKEKLELIIQTYDKFFLNATNAWKKDENSKCPEDTWNLYNTSIEQFKEDVKKLIDEYYEKEMEPEELQVIANLSAALDGYIEKVYKQIQAFKPNLSIEDLNGESVEDILKSDKKTPLNNKDRKKTDIVTYKSIESSLTKLHKNLQELHKYLDSKTPVEWTRIKEGAANAALCVGETVWNVLTSPLAKDMIKVFMYSNPITAMIFDGKLGNFGIGDSINKLKNKIKNKVEAATNPNLYDERHFPKEEALKGLTYRQLHAAYFENKKLLNMINTAYNHPKVTQKEKAALLKYTRALDKQFDERDCKGIRTNLRNLLIVCHKICDNLDWKKPSDWDSVLGKAINKKVAKGNTEKEQADIENQTANIKDDDEYSISKEDYELLQKTKQAQLKKQESYNTLAMRMSQAEN